MRPVSLSGVPVVAPELRVGPDDDLRSATQTLLANKLREIPVTDAAGQIVGLLDEADISRFYLDATTKTPPPTPVMSGAALAALLAFAPLGLEVTGDATCPAPADVARRLDDLLAPIGLVRRPRHRVTQRRDPAPRAARPQRERARDARAPARGHVRQSRCGRRRRRRSLAGGPQPGFSRPP